MPCSIIPFMVDSVCLMVEEFSEGEEFGKGGFDDIEEFFVGDRIDFISSSRQCRIFILFLKKALSRLCKIMTPTIQYWMFVS